ncbi:MAG TPA: GNAT family N-acetyltransferase [Rummeliibacillus sp.]|nr:GNAT family N-acetyltransferase [Rummeliibacillus sp.]
MEFIHVKGLPDEESIKGIQELHREVFDESELSIGELQEKPNLLCCMALDGRKVVGFKLGYEKEVGVFYSWLGGVSAEYRGQGIALKLMNLQHQLVSEQGYQKIRTIGRNYRRAMLILNIKVGFDIIETYFSKSGTRKIIMEKELK